MKKSETNNTPSIEEINTDLDKILNILKELDTVDLDLDINVDKVISNKIGNIGKKYKSPPDTLENK